MTKRVKSADAAVLSPSTQSKADAIGTERLASRWRSTFSEDFFRTTRTGLTVSSIALGTYLGESDDATDAMYADALGRALTSGINIVDTAINYRCQRSERVVGRVLQDLFAAGSLSRDEVVICTKGGYVPLDGALPESRAEYEAYVKREYLDTGILDERDLVAGGHAIVPKFLTDQLRRSRRNLGIQTIDCFYIHNPEQQLAAISSDELKQRLRAAFVALEECVGRNEISAYGCATWSGLRLPAGSVGHLSLYDLAAIARDVAGDDHHFRFVQLPINLQMSEAVRVSTQRDYRGRLVHVIDAASELGIDLVSSATLMQGRLAQDLPDQVRDVFPDLTDAQRAIEFVRAIPSVITAAVGMKSEAHVEENLGAVRKS